MNVAIVGSRGFEDEALIGRSIARLQQQHSDLVIVSGGARGADSIAERIARKWGVLTLVHLPEWTRYGKSAGFRRNDLIVASADMVIAFFADGPRSRGTANTVASAKVKGIPVHEYHEGHWTSSVPLALIADECPHCGEDCQSCPECEAERRHLRPEAERTDARGVLDPL